MAAHAPLDLSRPRMQGMEESVREDDTSQVDIHPRDAERRRRSQTRSGACPTEDQSVGGLADLSKRCHQVFHRKRKPPPWRGPSPEEPVQPRRRRETVINCDNRDSFTGKCHSHIMRFGLVNSAGEKSSSMRPNKRRTRSRFAIARDRSIPAERNGTVRSRCQ